MTRLEEITVQAMADYAIDKTKAWPSMIAFRTEGLAALQECAEAGGDDPWCTVRLYEPAKSFLGEARRARTQFENGFLAPTDLLALLHAGGLLSDEAFDQARGALPRNDLIQAWLQRTHVYRLLSQDAVQAAEEAAESERMGEDKWVAWRAIGEYYAGRGNAKEFLDRWSKYQTQKEKDWLNRMRRTLVEQVCRREGWEAAVALVKHKRISTASNAEVMMWAAMQPMTEAFDVPELNQLFRTREEFADLDSIARLQLLIDAMTAHWEYPAQHDHPQLAEILDQVIAIDHTVSKDQMRRRDYLLGSTWPAIGEKETLKRMRTAMRSPSQKREFNGLAKDVPSPNRRS